MLAVRASMLGLDEVTFIDLEADRSGRPLVLGWARGSEEGRVVLSGRRGRPAEFDELGPMLAGHNLRAFDLPLLSQAKLAPKYELAIDTLLISLLADPLRTSHALDKSGQRAGEVPDPVRDARLSRERLADSLAVLRDLEPEVLAWHAAMFARGGEPGLGRLLGIDAAPASDPEGLPESLLRRFCRVRLGGLLETLNPTRPAEALALSLALRFIGVASAERGRLSYPASPVLATLPRFTELLTRLMGPLCPDLRCRHRFECDVHRPYAEDILEQVFELPGFRPNQKEIVEAVLADRTPLVVLPTGGGKSLCYQVPAVHGAQRLRGLTVVVSPLQALMADQVRGLERRYPGTCLINASLLLEVRRQHLAGIRSGQYDVVYLGPEQLRNPSIVSLLARRPPFLWVVDEAHCISQWGHGFRTDYTYLPRAIAGIHAGSHRPLVALFTATAAYEVVSDIAAQLGRGLGVELSVMDFSAPRDNLEYEVQVVSDEGHKERELLSLLEAHPDGARLVYAATVRGVTELAERLRQRGIECAHYHGQLAPNEKREQLERFLAGRVNTVVATSAFGMGIDKPNIRLVVHHDLPGSVEDYVQETGRAGRDGAPSRCVLLFLEADLETQFYLKLAGLVSERDLRVVFLALRRRARRLRASDDGWVELWVSPEDLFVEEELEDVLDWSREGLHGKLKLVLYHLESDGVLERRENRTRTFAIDLLKPTLESALGALPVNRSPVSERVLRYLYSSDRPREVSILDVAEETGLTPAAAFRELHNLTDLGLVGQELRFELTFARQVANDTAGRSRLLFDTLETLFGSNEELEEAPVVSLRAASAELARRGIACPPHELHLALRALRKLGWVRLDKAGPGRFRVSADDGIEAVRLRLRSLRHTASALIEWADRRLVGKAGRDLVLDLDVAEFIADSRTLFTGITAEGARVAPKPPPGRWKRAIGAADQAQATLFDLREPAATPSRERDRALFDRHQRDEVVDAALVLHHFEAWHLSDPPVLFDTAFKVRFDPRRRVEALDLGRPLRQRHHEVSLVHLLREYAVRRKEERQRYLTDYFELPRRKLLDRYFKGRKRAIECPVSAHTESQLLAGLTDAQRDAVTAADAALLVVAGPGSGKTHTIVRRVAYMLRARQVRASEILILAFGRAAARELRERLLATAGSRARGVRVRTFHALALELTGEDVREDLAEAEQRLQGVVGRAAELLERSDDDASGEYHRQAVLGAVRHVLVDEYQDLDADQYRLLAAVVGLVRGKLPRGSGRTERSVVVVGDDDQAIFGFRSASVEFLQRFELEFEARRVCLVDCFRSRPEIVNAVVAFISQVSGRLKQAPSEQLRAVRREGREGVRAVRRFRYAEDEQLAAHLALVVEKSLASGTRRIGILARHWASLDAARGALESAGIPLCLSHRDHHRAIHRRHPADRVIQALYKMRSASVASAHGSVRDLLLRMGRDEHDPAGAELLSLAAEIDAELMPAPTRDANRQAAAVTGIGLSGAELADRLLLASRESDRRVGNEPVWLGTFHGAKGLEFDKVIVLPHVPRSNDPGAEEMRLFYVAMTRAKDELVLCTLGKDGELAQRVADAEEVDLRNHGNRLRAKRLSYMDATPRDLLLRSTEIGRAQARISRLREGDALRVVDEGDRVVLLAEPLALPASETGGEPPSGQAEPSFVGELSEHGVLRFRGFRARATGQLSARLHEVFVHLDRNKEGRVRKRSLVALPTFVSLVTDEDRRRH